MSNTRPGLGPRLGPPQSKWATLEGSQRECQIGVIAAKEWKGVLPYPSYLQEAAFSAQGAGEPSWKLLWSPVGSWLDPMWAAAESSSSALRPWSQVRNLTWALNSRRLICQGERLQHLFICTQTRFCFAIDPEMRRRLQKRDTVLTSFAKKVLQKTQPRTKHLTSHRGKAGSLRSPQLTLSSTTLKFIYKSTNIYKDVF